MHIMILYRHTVSVIIIHVYYTQFDGQHACRRQWFNTTETFSFSLYVYTFRHMPASRAGPTTAFGRKICAELLCNIEVNIIMSCTFSVR